MKQIGEDERKRQQRLYRYTSSDPENVLKLDYNTVEVDGITTPGTRSEMSGARRIDPSIKSGTTGIKSSRGFQTEIDELKSRASGGARSQKTSRSKLDGKNRFAFLKLLKHNVEKNEQGINE